MLLDLDRGAPGACAVLEEEAFAPLTKAVQTLRDALPRVAEREVDDPDATVREADADAL